MRAWQNWMRKPITRGNYLWMCVICYAVAAVYSGIYYVYVMEPKWWTGLKSTFGTFKHSVAKVFGK